MQQLVDNRYRIQRPLGSGGMADVYLAHDDILDRDVALKVMSGRYASDDEFVERFKREAQSAAALSHPNIVSIFDRGESEDGTYYIAMEYLPGGTLKDRILKRGALPARTAAAVAIQIAEALQAAHRRGVIHRDIKPHNILITEGGDIKVTDFGIARAASSSTMTKTGSILGTAHYISPEQAMGEPVGPASDLYSLGVVLYEMLTGRLPYDADTPLGIAMKHVNGHLRPPKAVDPSIPDGINAVTMRLLAKNPEDRYASAAELIEDLERVADGLDPKGATITQVMPRAQQHTAPTRVGGPLPKSHEDKQRRRLLPAFLTLLALLLLAPLAWAGYSMFQDARTVPVPNLVDMKLDEARQRYGDNFDIKVRDRVDSEKAVGTILEQDPSAGGEAREGSTIRVVVSGTQVAEVPDVRGEARDAAAQAIEGAGFQVNVKEQESDANQKGLVLSQSPEGGSKAALNSEVTITVGTGPPTVKVPDIPYGATQDDAAALLEKNNLKLGNVYSAPNDQIPEGGVIDQNPAPDTEVEEGTAVDITLSSGPEQVKVPDVTGKNVDRAARELASAGFSSTLVEQQSNEPQGRVIATDPPAGSMLDPGSTVTVYYSSGPPEPQPKPKPQPGDNTSGPGNATDKAKDKAKEARRKARGDD